MMSTRAVIQSDALINFPVKLAVPGTVKVHLGQSVEPGDLIAEAVLPAKFQVFDVLNQFRIQQSDLESSIMRLAGESVQRGDIIARKPGLIARIFRASEDGKVVAVRDGRVTLAMGEITIQALTPIAGVVGELIPGLGAEIVAHGFSVQGSWGNDRVSVGKLVMFDADADLNGSIIFLDHTVTLEEIQSLKEKGASGFVVTSLDPSSLNALDQSDLPLMSLLGFGEAVLDEYSRAAIEDLHHKQITLIARKADPYRDVKPELFQPRETEGTGELFAAPERGLLGRTVRLLGQPYFGSIGKIVELPGKPERLGNGMKSQVAVIEREDETVIRIPLQNVEILKD
ncbi:MAG: hypothetical protein AAGU15_10120 [Anaerolineaceae bacterium]